MSDRFFCETPIDWSDTGQPIEATLAGPEAHHLLHVMRLGVGDRVTLFDGLGAEYAAEVIATGRRDVQLAVQSRRASDREPPGQVVLGVALPKGDRQKVLVEKLTEVGCTRLVPLVTVRGVAKPKPAALDKLRRLVIEASKQCGRNRLMAIDEPTPLDAFLAGCDAGERLIAHPDAAPIPAADPGRLAAGVAFAVGPEGGFTDSEVADATAAGWRTATLGQRILRIETAAVVLAASRAIAGPVG